MRRLLMVSAVAALMAAMTALMAAPAMALDLDSNDDDRNDFVFFGHNDDHDDFGDFFGFDVADGFAVDNEAESGAVDLSFDVTNTGDYASQCVPATQFGNSGNFNNAPTFAQFGSDSGDFEPGGIEFSVSPEVAVDCSNTIQQSSAASSTPYYNSWR